VTSTGVVLDGVIQAGIVVEAGSVDSDGGRPRVLLRINPDYGYVIGVDVGEIRVRVELFDLTMTERAKVDYPLDPGQHDAGVIVEAILAGLTAVLAGSGVSPSAVRRRSSLAAWDRMPSPSALPPCPSRPSSAGPCSPPRRATAPPAEPGLTLIPGRSDRVL